MMPRRNDRHRHIPMDWPSLEKLGVGSGIVDMMTRDNAKMREAGCNLAEAAARVVRDYDGLHRLSIAISAWFTAIAGEGDRDTRHAASGTETEGQDATEEQRLGAKHEGPTSEGGDAKKPEDT